jgi:hypothetical protein
MKTEDELIEILRKQVKESGGLRKWAIANGCHMSTIEKVYYEVARRNDRTTQTICCGRIINEGMGEKT